MTEILPHLSASPLSVRHGLDELDRDIYDEVPKIFNIKTNIGFIGGKGSRAYYFIGYCGDNLIFLDPHYIQPTIGLNQFGISYTHETYKPGNIYFMNVKDLSPSFTIGFAVKDMKDFKLLMKDLNGKNYFINQKVKKGYDPNKNYIFTVKNWHHPIKEGDDSNQDIAKHANFVENYY